MKKFLYLLLAATLAFSTVGCGNQIAEKETEEETETEKDEDSSSESAIDKLADALRKKGILGSQGETATDYVAYVSTETEVSLPEVVDETDVWSEEEYYDDYSYDYDYSDVDYYYDDYYSDDDYYYDDYYLPDEYNDGNGGYYCNYGAYYAVDSNGVIIANMDVSNEQGSMCVSFGFYYGNDYEHYATGFVYTDATEAFGDASRNTEVEMYDVGDEYGGNFYSEQWMDGGLLTVIVYWPEDHAYFKFVGGDGRTFEFDMYP